MVISSICQKFLKTSLELYGWQFDMEGIHALFDNYYVMLIIYLGGSEEG